MKEDRKFLRQCSACRSYKEKGELIRITSDYITGQAVINTENKVYGRSVYICKNSECVKKFLKNKKNLNKLKLQQNAQLFEELNHYLI